MRGEGCSISGYRDAASCMASLPAIELCACTLIKFSYCRRWRTFSPLNFQKLQCIAARCACLQQHCGAEQLLLNLYADPSTTVVASALWWRPRKKDEESQREYPLGRDQQAVLRHYEAAYPSFLLKVVPLVFLTGGGGVRPLSRNRVSWEPEDSRCSEHQ